MDRILRLATPVVLISFAVMVLFAPALPGLAALDQAFGANSTLRIAVAVLCLYVLILILERQRMETTFRELLGGLRKLKDDLQHRAQGSGDQEPARREAIQILVSALESKDPEVRARARVHLQRLTGEDLGEDATAWRSWAQRQGPRA